MKNINHKIFWPSVLLLGGASIASLLMGNGFVAALRPLHDYLLDALAPVYAWSVFSFVILVGIIYFSPLSRVRIGGAAAAPLLRPLSWFAITLCTTIATGLLFWGTAEPLFHLHQPPAGMESADIQNLAQFSLSSVIMHWTISPYAIYTLLGIAFALAYYQLELPFRPSSMLVPFLGAKLVKNLGNFLDVLCLFSLVGGMTASLCAGILTLSGGLRVVAPLAQSPFLYFFIAFSIVATFVLSAVSGLQKGIKRLSRLNLIGFIIILMGFASLVHIPSLTDLSVNSLRLFFSSFLTRSVNLNDALDEVWFKSWTIFNWANWLAWAPVTALFLGYIAKGYTIRSFIHVNLLLPALFGTVWMSLLGGSALLEDIATHGSLYQAMQQHGPEAAQYMLIEKFPLKPVFALFFIGVTFISYVTAADSNTTAISNLCRRETGRESESIFLKVIWGVIIGILAVMLVLTAGLEGIKMISVLGGIPALFFSLLAAVALLKLTVESFTKKV